MSTKYNFNIIFEKLEEAKKNQKLFNNGILENADHISEEIKNLKNIYDDIQEAKHEIFTRT
jgi:uncharacterized protein YfkK (UPF0435 family)